jgi:hypothetical protein
MFITWYWSILLDVILLISDFIFKQDLTGMLNIRYAVDTFRGGDSQIVQIIAPQNKSNFNASNSNNED